MAKYLFQGKELEELKKMELREFARLLNSRQRRSVNRRYEEIQKFLQRVEKKVRAGKNVRTHARDMIVLPQMVGVRIQIHTGKTYVPVDIREEMIGHYLGEFAPTRTVVKHGAPGVGATKSSAALSVK